MNSNCNPILGPDSLPGTLLERLKHAVETRGHLRVIHTIGLSQAAFWRAMAGGKIRAGTVHQIEAGLDALDREAGR